MTDTDTEHESRQMFSDIMVKTHENELSISGLKVGLGKVETKTESIADNTQFIRDYMATAIDKKVDFRVFVLLVAFVFSVATLGYSVYAGDKDKKDDSINILEKDVLVLTDDVKHLQDGFEVLKDGQSKILDKLDEVKKKDDPDKDG